MPCRKVKTKETSSQSATCKIHECLPRSKRNKQSSATYYVNGNFTYISNCELPTLVSNMYPTSIITKAKVGSHPLIGIVSEIINQTLRNVGLGW